MNYKRFGNNIRYFREKADLTQEQLANKVGVTRSYECKIENGKKVPCIDVGIDLANALGVKMSDLIEELKE